MGLEVEGLSLSRGGRRVVTGLGFALSPGQAMTLRGPNGAGKSTLLRALGGLIPVDAGRIVLNGTDLARDRDRVIEAIAFAGHLDAVKPQLTVAENLRFWARLVGGNTEAAMTGFRLSGIGDRLAGLCSAGQKRRLGLARLLLAPRALWLLDEPTVSLDTETVAVFAGHLAAHCARGGMALVATHADLGLPGLGELRLDGVRPRVAQETDPFAQGDWG